MMFGTNQMTMMMRLLCGNIDYYRYRYRRIKMKKNYKTAFIAEHGAEMFNLLKLYWRGNRSIECVEAKRLYHHYQQGLNESLYTIYSITEFGKVVYIGMTGTESRQRWYVHKSRARTLRKAAPLHRAMNEISSDHKNFPAYRFSILHTTTDKVAAQALEIAEIGAHETNKTGYNIYTRKGNTNKKFLKDDAILDIVKLGYPL